MAGIQGFRVVVGFSPNRNLWAKAHEHPDDLSSSQSPPFLDKPYRDFIGISWAKVHEDSVILYPAINGGVIKNHCESLLNPKDIFIEV